MVWSLLASRGGRVSPLELGVVLLMGVLAGLVAGYMLMGTAHAILEIGADSARHYKHGD